MAEVKDYVLELSTQVVPGSKFSVDGEEYEMVNPDHLSEEAEASFMAKFALHQRNARRLDNSRNEQEARKHARDLRKSRLAILVELTDMPHDVAAKLPLSAQAALIETIQDTLGLVPDDEPGEPESA